MLPNIIAQACAIPLKKHKYLFSFQFSCSIDASNEPEESGPWRGRLVNHGNKKNRNAIVRQVSGAAEPSLAIFALREIEMCGEILYDYGVQNLGFLKQVSAHVFPYSVKIQLKIHH